MRKEPHDVDDGWWEGELRDQKGLFPSLVVEPCAPDGSPLSALEVSQFSFCQTCRDNFQVLYTDLIFFQDDETPPTSFAPPPEHTPPEVPDYILTDEFENSELNGTYSMKASSINFCL